MGGRCRAALPDAHRADPADLARRLPFGTLPALYYANKSTGEIMQAKSYAVDESCFGLFAPQPNTPVSDGACVLQISIGEAF